MIPRPYALFALLLLAVAGAYSNHFLNSFHFDDSHTIETNIHIRSLSNLPKFFTDATTFSNLPTHQVYRPLLTTSLAIDYLRGGGTPLAFHVTNFCFFLLLVWTIWRLYSTLLDGAWMPALVAASIYALHPVIAETINYVIQRGDLLSTLGVTAALLMYIRLPRFRRWGLYLLPLVAALLVKPPALVFPVILFAWVFLFEESGDWRLSARAILPSVAVSAAMGWFLSSMTAATFAPGGTSPLLYRVTQMYVSLYYFSAFFAPVHLTADTDWKVLSGFEDPRAWAGAAFLAAVVLAIVSASRRREWRPVAFGLVWFLAALFPTAWMPLAEVANDHRMFFPFVGLALAVVHTAGQLLLQWSLSPGLRRAVAGSVVGIVLALEGRGTWLRNEVWRTEETLWRDAIQKSPGNGRALMNYALTLMSRGANDQALPYLERAHLLLPNYFYLEINLGIANGGSNRPAKAEAHFRRAEQLEPRRYESHFYYARWLLELGRVQEAADHLRTALACNPYALDAHHLLMRILAEKRDWIALQAAVADALRIVPGDAEALRFGGIAAEANRALETVAVLARQNPTPENWLNYSLHLYQAGRFKECIDAAGQALRIRPDYAEAWNNIAAAHNAMQDWNAGIRAAEQALRLNPAFELARNNRAWAISQRQTAKP
ncbi:MAG TPA: tetratricopeptide repeat protein [Paludibaculum sp.]|jgi:tetratricopeptide (TPR) repeat protein